MDSPTYDGVMTQVELGESAFWVLATLADERRHGYAIMREVERTSEGRVKLKVTTLYAALERLERSGWVAADGEEVVDGRARRYYRLTEAGLDRLTAEVRRLEDRARAARVRLKSRIALAGGLS